MQKNLVTFIVLSILFFAGWSWFMKKYYPAQEPKPKAAAEAARPSKEAPKGAQAAPSPPPAAVPAKPAVPAFKEERVTVRTKNLEAVLTSRGAQIVSWKLLPFREEKHDSKPVELVPLSPSASEFAVFELGEAGLPSQAWTLETRVARLLAGGGQEVAFSTKLAGTTVLLRKTFAFDPESFLVRVQVDLENQGRQDWNLFKGSLVWGRDLGNSQVTYQGGLPNAGVVQMEGKIERESADDEERTFSYKTPKWAALRTHYFVAAWLPDGEGFGEAEIRRHRGKRLSVALVAPPAALKAGEKRSLSARLYAGPQVYETLKDLGRNLQAVVQFQYWKLFDWLNPLCVALLKILRWFHAATGNWGIAVILLTALVRGALFYPSWKSMISMRRMQTRMAAMKPRLDSLKKTYKDDPQKLNQETMRLYKEQGVNPLGGCLPMLVQIPIFFALYGTLMAAFELRGAGFFWKWDDLSGPDQTHLLSLFMGASMFLQQKMTPQSASLSDEQAQMQKMMLYFMPISFTVMALLFKWPTGLLLYWSVSNVFAIAQQWYVNKTVT